MKKYMRQIGLAVFLGVVVWGCGNSQNPMGVTENTTVQSQSLSKQAIPNGPAMVVAELVQDGVPVAGATVALSRSVSGQEANYVWEGTTDSDGRTSIEITDSKRVSGYYSARAMNAAGDVIDTWTSIPISAGRETFLFLPVGDRAEASAGSAAGASFTVRIENISAATPAYAASGFFNTPVGASGPGPLLPGSAYAFSFNAPPGSHLSFATMFVHSNDFFYAPDEDGIALWDGSGNQISGDITSQVLLWDSGTEVNQEPGSGADQAPRQSGANTGASDADNTVRLAPDTFSNLPAVSDVIRVTIVPTSATGFHVTIENVSDATTLTTAAGDAHAVPMAPGVWVVHSSAGPLFTNGQADYGDGLAALAEDGNPSGLAEALAADSGIPVPLAPGVWATHRAPGILFRVGQADAGDGLEALAEDGNPAGLASALSAASAVASSGVFTTPTGADGPGPLFTGGSYEFTFSATPGERLSFATMFVTSNDFFYAPGQEGIALWDGRGNPIAGDITGRIRLWDAGTEENQVPGAGSDQAPEQSGPNTGASDTNNSVRLAPNTYGNIPHTSATIRVTITPGS